jgi:D-sedoheptulose 7-phosphate isomerase
VDALLDRLPVLASCRASIDDAIELLDGCARQGGKLLVCGNGGSASDSEHLVGDLMKGFLLERPIPLEHQARLRNLAGATGDELALALQRAIPAVALSSNGALTTAIANDVRFEMVFAQQVYGLGRPGDALFAISTTGTSRSVVLAAIVARLLDARVVVLTGRDGGELVEHADVAIRVPADRVYEVQELHLPIYHAIARSLELLRFGGGVASGPAGSHEGRGPA